MSVKLKKDVIDVLVEFYETQAGTACHFAVGDVVDQETRKLCGRVDTTVKYVDLDGSYARVGLTEVFRQVSCQ